jgi:hypothetical protein
MVNTIAQAMPADEEKLLDLLGDGHETLAAKLLPEAMKTAEVAIGEHLRRVIKQTESVLKTMEC